MIKLILYTSELLHPKPHENIESEVANSLKEEFKEDASFQIKKENSNPNVSRPWAESNIEIEKWEEESGQDKISEDKEVLNKLKTSLKQRKKYKANWMHKILTIIPSFMWKYKGLLRK